MKDKGYSSFVSYFLARFEVRAIVLVLAALWSAACANVLGIDEPVTEAPSAGQAGIGGGVGGSDGVDDPAGGEGGDADAGAPDPGGDTLRILGDATTPSCEGSDVEVTLTAGGGVEPYTWDPLESDIFRLVPSTKSSSLATVSGTVASAGDIEFTVGLKDARGLPARRTFNVSVAPVPKIQVPTVPSVCPGEVYSLPLQASGGNPLDYAWITTLPPSTGLKVPEGKSILTGTFSAPTGVQKLDFTLRLDGGNGCKASSVALSLPIAAANDAVCAQIDVDGQQRGTPLPRPCAGYPYAETLVAHGASGAYEWNLAGEAPPGLSFDPNTASVTGTISHDETLTVQATNAESQRTFEASFSLEPRDKCWFAYVSKTAQFGQLNLFDPVLKSRERLPKQPNGEFVSDFKFSPNGKYVAYRLAAPAAKASLVLVRLEDFGQQRFEYANVTQYEWSPDSQFLAVSYSDVDGDQLILLRTTAAVPDTAGRVPPVLTFLASLPKTVSVSGMAWANPTHLAFFEVADPLAPDFWGFGLSKAGVDGIGASASYDAFDLSGDSFHPAPDGVFTISSAFGIFFYPNDPSDDDSKVVLHDPVTIAPSGRYVAKAVASRLEVFPAAQTSSSSSKAKAHPGCDTVLAWAEGTERIACQGTSASGQAQLQFFDVDPDTGQVSSISDAGVLLSGSSSKQRRAFSASGARFAFASKEALSVISFDAPTQPYSVAISAALQSDFAELAFAPGNEQLLLQHRGKRLSLFNLQSSVQHETVVVEDLGPVAACSDLFADDTA
ncbi:MAG: hypothetical protein ABW061_28510, partial [Polyangiaceae bacterium]